MAAEPQAGRRGRPVGPRDLAGRGREPERRAGRAGRGGPAGRPPRRCRGDRGTRRWRGVAQWSSPTPPARAPRRAAAGGTEDPDGGEGPRSGRRRRRRRGSENGPPPETVAARLATEGAARDAVEVSPIVQPEAAELAGVAEPAEPDSPP